MTFEKRAVLDMFNLVMLIKYSNDFVKLYISSVQFSHSVVSNSL